VIVVVVHDDSVPAPMLCDVTFFAPLGAWGEKITDELNPASPFQRFPALFVFVPTKFGTTHGPGVGDGVGAALGPGLASALELGAGVGVAGGT